MKKDEQQAEDIRVLGFLLAEWGKAVAEYTVTVHAAGPVPHGGAQPGGGYDTGQRRAILQQQRAWAILEETSKRLAMVLSRHWRPSQDDP